MIPEIQLKLQVYDFYTLRIPYNFKLALRHNYNKKEQIELYLLKRNEWASVGNYHTERRLFNLARENLHLVQWKEGKNRNIRYQDLHICWMNFVTTHNFMQSHKIVTKTTENCEMTENCDSNCGDMLKRLPKYFWFHDFAQFSDFL